MKNVEKKENLSCSFCDKICHNLNSLRCHEMRCSKNSQRIENKGNRTNHSNSWNKGLTKEVNEKLREISNQYKGRLFNKFKGKASTKEKELKRRRNISKTMREKHLGGLRKHSGRGHKGYYKGYYCDSTYELVWIIYCIEHNIKFKRCNLCYVYEMNNVKHKYYPDFILEDGSLVEIKGYYTPQVDCKTASVKDRIIKVLYKKDLQYAFDYVKNNFVYNHLEELYDKED